jgi:CRP/FNR family cyclic AMP-dependent transcriptional regulator
VEADAVVAALGRSLPFAGLDPDVLQALAPHVRSRRLRARQVLFSQGDPGDCAYVLAAGAVKLSWPDRDGDDLTVATLLPGDLFGELALIDGGPRSAWAEATTATEVLVITPAVWAELLGHPAFVQHLLVDLSARVRATTRQLAEHALVDLAGRVAATLIRLGEARGHPTSDGVRIPDPPTQGELASMVASSRQSVNAVLRGMERRGDIATDAGSITLRRPDALRRRAEI